MIIAKVTPPLELRSAVNLINTVGFWIVYPLKIVSVSEEATEVAGVETDEDVSSA